MSEPSPSNPPQDAAGTELAALRARIWAELLEATRHRTHAWRMASLATVTPEGLPDARTVVLREADPEAGSLTFYTDQRSPKVSQMQAQALGMLVVWSASLSWQLRLRVRLQVEDSGLSVTSRWAALRMTPGAQDYLSPLPPGSRLGGAGLHISRATRGHFAVVTAQVLAIDWLQLRAGGHRRAQFAADGDACWVQA